MMKITITKTPPGAFSDADGQTVSPGVGEEVEVEDALGKSLVDGGYAEEGSASDPSEDSPDATPKAAEKADELGVDLSDVEGTGSEGRITVEDVEKAAREASGPSETPTAQGPTETR